MFGFSFSELVVVILVALAVIGPKDLPKVLRRLGRWAGTIRQTAAALRAQSGIDEILRSDGLADDLAEIRKLARGELDAVQDAVRVEVEAEAPTLEDGVGRGHVIDGRSREYPCDGADSYGALPDGVDIEALRPSGLAAEPLYVRGEPDAELVPLAENGASVVVGAEAAASTPDERSTEDEDAFEDDSLPVRDLSDEMHAGARA